MNLIVFYSSFLMSTFLLACLQWIAVLKYREYLITRSYLKILVSILGIELSVLLSMYSPDANWAAWWHGSVRFAIYAFFPLVGYEFVLALIQQFSGHAEKAHYKWVVVIVTLSALLGLSSPWNHILIREYAMVQSAGVYIRHSWTPGWWYPVFWVTSYGLNLASGWVLWQWLRRTRQVLHYRGVVTMICFLMILGASLLDNSSLSPTPGILITPVILGVANIIMIASLRYLDLFDVLPAARETLIQHMSDMVLVLDAQNRVLDMNPASERTSGFKLDEMKGQTVLSWIKPEHQEEVREILEHSFFRGEFAYEIKKVLHHFDISITTIYRNPDYLGARLIVLRYITELKKLQQEERKLAALEERQRLARELHDSVNQTLYSTLLMADILMKEAGDRLSDSQQSTLKMLARLVKSALGEMRMLLIELRPEGLLNTDLKGLYMHLVDAMGSRSSANIRLSCEGEAFALPVEVKTALYRIAQEGLNNAARHAHASHIELGLAWEKDSLQIRIYDDGRGFRMDQQAPGHFGMSIMRERAGAVGAALTIDSQLGQGTRITCAWGNTPPSQSG